MSQEMPNESIETAGVELSALTPAAELQARIDKLQRDFASTFLPEELLAFSRGLADVDGFRVLMALDLKSLESLKDLSEDEASKTALTRFMSGAGEFIRSYFEQGETPVR